MFLLSKTRLQITHYVSLLKAGGCRETAADAIRWTEDSGFLSFSSSLVHLENESRR